MSEETARILNVRAVFSHKIAILNFGILFAEVIGREMFSPYIKTNLLKVFGILFAEAIGGEMSSPYI